MYNTQMESIAESIGKKFRIGMVANGGRKSIYSISIPENQFQSFCSRYPDTRVVCKDENGEIRATVEPVIE